MRWETIILLGLAVNIDNLCAGLGYGRAKKQIPWGTNLVIALISGAFAGAACAIALWMAGGDNAAASVAGALLLAGLGVYALCGALSRNRGEDEAAGELEPLGGGETVVLGVGLALNCLCASFGLGLGGVSWLWLGSAVTVFSFLAVGIGGYLGARGARPCGARWFHAVRGLMLIAIAAWELLI